MRWFRVIALLGILAGAVSCRRGETIAAHAPAPGGQADRTFRSVALGRDVTYRVRMPVGVQLGGPVRIVYLLHGNGGSRREWSEWSGMAELAPKDWELVMPDGGSSYWVNSATVKADRYEDFIKGDLIADAERGVRVQDRAILGNSMGGFAAIVLAMKHPALYRFAGAMSPPVDYPGRKFTWRRWGQSMGIRSIFGPEGSATRRENDPFVLAKTVDPKGLPYFWISCGDQEALLEPVRRFDALLTKRHIAHEFHVERGGHDWGQWNTALDAMLTAMEWPRSVA